MLDGESHTGEALGGPLDGVSHTAPPLWSGDHTPRWPLRLKLHQPKREILRQTHYLSSCPHWSGFHTPNRAFRRGITHRSAPLVGVSHTAPDRVGRGFTHRATSYWSGYRTPIALIGPFRSYIASILVQGAPSSAIGRGFTHPNRSRRLISMVGVSHTAPDRVGRGFTHRATSYWSGYRTPIALIGPFRSYIASILVQGAPSSAIGRGFTHPNRSRRLISMVGGSHTAALFSASAAFGGSPTSQVSRHEHKPSPGRAVQPKLVGGSSPSFPGDHPPSGRGIGTPFVGGSTASHLVSPLD